MRVARLATELPETKATSGKAKLTLANLNNPNGLETANKSTYDDGDWARRHPRSRAP